MKLYNTEDAKKLKNSLYLDTIERTTMSFYKYYQINNPQVVRDHLYGMYDLLEVKGRIYVAYEGINAQISVPTEKLAEFIASNDTIDFLKGIRLNSAIQDNGKSFFKLKIQVRDKIVADGINDKKFNPSNTGTYLKAQEFNKLIDNDKTVLIDMRNHYESEIGHFRNAWTPDVDTFRESLPKIVSELEEKKNNPIVMYCTGGIRCEKASAYMKHNGFKDVYHLEGGIIEYARQVKNLGLENKFKGKNFVFDERLGEKINNEVIANCHQCGEPCDTHTNCKNEACHLLFIQCKSCEIKFRGCCSAECDHTASLPLNEQKELRKGKATKRNIFKKGRSALPFAKKAD